jgi:hypothetical protein
MSGTYHRPITLRVALVCGATIVCIFCVPTAGSAWPIGLWDVPSVGGQSVQAVRPIGRTIRTADAGVSNDFIRADLTGRGEDLIDPGNFSTTGDTRFFDIPDTDGAGISASAGFRVSSTSRGDGFAGRGDNLDGLAGLTGDLRDRFASLSDDQRDSFAALIDELREKAKTANNENQPNGRGRGLAQQQSEHSDNAGRGVGSNGSVGGSNSSAGGATSFQVVTVPEPSTVTLLGAGMISAAMFGRRRSRRRSA